MSGPQVDAAGNFSPTVAGSHTLTYQVGTGSCVTQDNVVVTVNPLPEISVMDAVDW